MKFKTKFARVINEAQFIEAVVTADSEEEAQIKFDAGDFDRFLIMKRELQEINPVGKPEFARIK